MSEFQALERFLSTDPRDVGCAEAMAILHVYADLMGLGEDAATRYPGVAVHLAPCGPGGEGLAGLLAGVIGDHAAAQPSPPLQPPPRRHALTLPGLPRR